jgi:transcriptional regulator with XRE-family HTH domain
MLLGTQLRRLREAADMSAEKAGYEIRASRSKISRMETGRVGLKLRDIEDLLTLYGVTDEKQRAKIIALARRSRDREWWILYNDVLPDWFETYLGLESGRGLHRAAHQCRLPWTNARTSNTTSRSPTSSAARL